MGRGLRGERASQSCPGGPRKRSETFPGYWPVAPARSVCLAQLPAPASPRKRKGARLGAPYRSGDSSELSEKTPRLDAIPKSDSSQLPANMPAKILSSPRLLASHTTNTTVRLNPNTRHLCRNRRHRSARAAKSLFRAAQLSSPKDCRNDAPLARRTYRQRAVLDSFSSSFPFPQSYPQISFRYRDALTTFPPSRRYGALC